MRFAFVVLMLAAVNVEAECVPSGPGPLPEAMANKVCELGEMEGRANLFDTVAVDYEDGIFIFDIRWEARQPGGHLRGA